MVKGRRTVAIWPSAGKYMFDDSGEKRAASDTMYTSCFFRVEVKIWYGGSSVSFSFLRVSTVDATLLTEAWCSLG